MPSITNEACVQGVDTGFVTLGYAKVAVLGVVQGLTELLPISSTAHMRVVPGLLGWPDPGSAFSAAMQLAALAAVVSYYWRDLREIVVGSLGAVARRDFGSVDVRFAVGIVLATVPIVVAGVLLSPVLNACGSPLRTLPVIAWACVVMGLLLAFAEAAARHRRPAREARLRDMLAVGIAQVGALVPGVSRSGSTLTGALMLGFKRADAARISFLLGLPAILLAGLREIWILHKAGLSAQGWSVLGVGLVVASLSAFAAIWLLMRVLERFSAWPFVLYRIALGIGLLAALHVGLLAA
ncbi:undecaprenyl-diphosphate phosphatase [Methylobacterium nodulans]|uniref:Undecaprenyl-diphosphatase n=1 Tax=Methylobacterium nodulans (strain LMG 21967 / CNCM I-2342 / ORS 2060) TaxID=460265 RepID=B8IFK6_METNO|nr:undecaprenyl-diphosphate phosphatase [Methylobacterium nodulans]ACL57741.1 undecaprenol kinase [Methylobacterium nodulans ORS 2060]